ncbi:hydroxymethylpyrimidine/phosphomethylpyrimidine kinase [Nevskia sp.]|uniref:bifunctional hydroxymethylpyrimidine kinase/phosphomethylpyrimidine kinase n=1 Tax=Nevskia sp. TaxID=1929292 RepID=UPI0025E7600A|nr:hydroxymethylpyrimidine/phosphomethylpyrimidine kinase [Nevskia sp.]
MPAPRPLKPPLKSSSKPPIVLCLSGHDPGGGAGLQADLETLAAHGVHGVGVITALTVQDSRNVRRVIPTDAALLAEQLNVLLADVQPQAVKIGLIGDAAQLPVIAAVLARLGLPVVCDPVLRAGGGTDLVAAAFPAALRRALLPQVTVLTPNAAEARRLVPDAADLDACAAALLADGARHVLITGGDEPGETVVNRLYSAGNASTSGPIRHEWPRLPETFHGAGCTLASAIAARLALADAPVDAVATGQRWTQAALARAVAIGRGRRIPGRIPPPSARIAS